MTILQVCAFAAPNAGNFIASLTHLERELLSKGIKTIYAFSDGAENKSWCREIQKRTKVYFLPTAKARILPRTYRIFKKIYAENDIGITHSHFELYDIPATVTAPKNVKLFWHLHDPVQVGKGVRALLWKFQYGVAGKRAMLLSVADHYRKEVIKLGFPENQTENVLNCIDLDRIKDCSRSDKKIEFLTFGWDFFRKGDDLILDACDRLEKEGYKFKFILNGNEKTWGLLDKYLEGRKPGYLIKGEPVDDVNLLFGKSKVFIQASRRETFSYAVCEAAYAGLPVISSDIAGLEWAHELSTVAFFPCEDSSTLYELMKQCLDDKTVSDEQIAESRLIIHEKFSLDAWTRQIKHIYGV